MSSSQQVQKHPRYRVQAEVDVVDASAALRRLPLANISLGGMFIKTPHASAPGAMLRLRLHGWQGEESLGLSARVVHVIDEPTGVLKRHPAGMGVQYQQVSSHGVALLQAFVARLVSSAQAVPARVPAARFVDAKTVVVDTGREVLHALWEQSLSVGGLFAEGAPPPLGSPVEVRIGQLRLCAEVVHVQPGAGAGLQITDPTGEARAVLMRYLAGGVEQLRVATVAPRGPPLGKVLAVVRQLFTGLEAADGFAALGLPTTADADEVKKRAASLKRIFSTPHPDASPPQAARIEGALRALTRIEPALLARVAALRNEAELIPRAREPRTEKNELTELLEAAAVAERGGHTFAARRELQRALDHSPDDLDVKRRLAGVQQTIDAAKAAEALAQAEVFVKGLGMRDDAARIARQALQLSQAREIRLRALGVLAKSGCVDEAIDVGESLLAAAPNDPLALQLLMHLYERTQQRVRAARTGEALLRLRPGDVELQRTVRRLIKAART